MQNTRGASARCVGVCLAIVAIVTSSSAKSEDIHKFGVRTVNMAWSPSEGVIDGYLVVVFRNGTSGVVEEYVETPEVTLSGEYGDSVTMRVRAIGTSSQTGEVIASEFSPHSPTIHFNPPPAAASLTQIGFHSTANAQISVISTSNPQQPTNHPSLPYPWQPFAIDGFDGSEQQVAWRNVQSGQLATTPLTTVAYFRASTSENMSQSEVLATSDLDGDGDADFLIHNRASGEVRSWASARTIRPILHYRDVRGENVVGVADLNGDNKSDIWEITGGNLRVWDAARNSRVLAEATVFDFGDPVHVADFDGNSAPDILWRTSDRAFAITYLDSQAQTVRQASFPRTSDDPNLDVVDTARLLGRTGLEIFLVDRRDNSLWVMFPTVETLFGRVKTTYDSAVSGSPIDAF